MLLCQGDMRFWEEENKDINTYVLSRSKEVAVCRGLTKALDRLLGWI